MPGHEEFPTVTKPVDLDQLPAFISVPHAAKLLGLSRATAYRYAASGALPTKRFEKDGRVYVITAKIRPYFDGSEVLAA